MRANILTHSIGTATGVRRTKFSVFLPMGSRALGRFSAWLSTCELRGRTLSPDCTDRLCKAGDTGVRSARSVASRTLARKRIFGTDCGKSVEPWTSSPELRQPAPKRSELSGNGSDTKLRRAAPLSAELHDVRELSRIVQPVKPAPELRPGSKKPRNCPDRPRCGISGNLLKPSHCLSGCARSRFCWSSRRLSSGINVLARTAIRVL